MRIFALSDLHLSFSGAKPMDVFGPHWSDHPRRIAEAWREAVRPGDVVCLAGDFSWASRLKDAQAELDWLAALPGRKVLVKGNHDYWWDSLSKVRAALPPGIHALQNDSLSLDGAAFAGARGWVDPSLDFSSLCGEGPGERSEEPLFSILGVEEDRKVYEKELGRLDASLGRMERGARLKVALLHFPPTSPALEETAVTRLLEKHGVDVALFGHLHLTAPCRFRNPYGKRGGVTYYLTSADFVDFRPIQAAELP